MAIVAFTDSSTCEGPAASVQSGGSQPVAGMPGKLDSITGAAATGAVATGAPAVRAAPRVWAAFEDFLLLFRAVGFLALGISTLLYPSRSRWEGSSCACPPAEGRSSSLALCFSRLYSASLIGRPMGTASLGRELSAG